MRVVILTWEYPPRTVGEISRHVENVVTALMGQGIDVSVVTFHDTMQGLERKNGVDIYRVGNPVEPHLSILTWNLTLATEFERIVSDIHYSTHGGIDLIDAHEWLSVVPATVLKKAFGTKFIYTIYSLEEQRSKYSDAPLNISVRNLEHLGLSEASKVIVDSEWMKSETSRLHDTPRGRIVPIPHDSPTWANQLVEVYKEAAAQ